jgi:hypothetical protein
MATIEFEFPESALGALERLADLTGREGNDRLGLLVQDALRVYEWVLAQQAAGRTVVALERPELEVLAHHRDLHGRRESLASFIPPDMLPRAQAYFAGTPS